MRLFPKLVCLSLVLLLAFGCRRVATQTEIPLSAVAKDLQAQGYRAEKRFINAPTTWETSHFRMRSRTVVAFKAEQPFWWHGEKYFNRFSLAEENYDSANDARAVGPAS